MTSTDLEILNLKRQVEIQNNILMELLVEFKRFNDNYEKINKFKSENYGGD